MSLFSTVEMYDFMYVLTVWLLLLSTFNVYLHINIFSENVTNHAFLK